MKKTELELKILIIDDEPDVRERLGNILKRRGYYVFTAKDGREGLQKAIENRVDIIICDIFMPNMNGVEFLREIREINLKAEVVVVTGAPTIEVCAEAFERNAVEYLTKPLTIEDILNSLAKAEERIHPTYHFSLPM